MNRFHVCKIVCENNTSFLTIESPSYVLAKKELERISMIAHHGKLVECYVLKGYPTKEEAVHICEQLENVKGLLSQGHIEL